MLARRNCIAAMGDDEERPVKRERGERGGKNRASKKAWEVKWKIEGSKNRAVACGEEVAFLQTPDDVIGAFQDNFASLRL